MKRPSQFSLHNFREQSEAVQKNFFESFKNAGISMGIKNKI